MSSATAPLRTFVTALLLAVMVLVPVIDAFVCSMDDVPAASLAPMPEAAPQALAQAATLAEHGSQEHPQDSEQAHEACAHGHCHHAFALARSPAMALLNQHGSALPSTQAMHASTLADGLKRPPRV